MALSTTISKTSWSTSLAAYLIPLEGQVAPSAWRASISDYFIGNLNEDGFSLETDEGDELELRDINNQLIDSQKREATVSVTLSLLKPSHATLGKFWKVTEGTNGEMLIASFVNTTKYALYIANVDAVGSESLYAPKVSVSAIENYESDKGYITEAKCKFLKGKEASTESVEYFYKKGVVAAPVQE